MEVEPRIARQYKCQHCCICKNYRGKVNGGKSLCPVFWLTRKEMLVVKTIDTVQPGLDHAPGNVFLTSNLACLVFQQLDNQLNLAVFPTVLSPLPPPKSVAAESGKNSNILSVKYFCSAMSHPGKRLKRTLFIMTKHNTQMFWASPFFKLRNDI